MRSTLRAVLFLSLALVLGLPAQAEDPEIVLDLTTDEAVADDDEEAVDFTSALAPLPDDTLQPVAICRLIPQCDQNADCDAGCGGAGLGKCVHSKCPVRVCRCR